MSHAHNEFSLLIVSKQRSLHKCLVTRALITNPTYLVCLPFLNFQKCYVTFYIAISTFNNTKNPENSRKRDIKRDYIDRQSNCVATFHKTALQ